MRRTHTVLNYLPFSQRQNKRVFKKSVVGKELTGREERKVR
jgi:hypothetical protein